MFAIYSVLRSVNVNRNNDTTACLLWSRYIPNTSTSPIIDAVDPASAVSAAAFCTVRPQVSQCTVIVAYNRPVAKTTAAYVVPPLVFLLAQFFHC